MRYDTPAAELLPYVSGYAVYISDDRRPQVNWYLPAPGIISILLDAGPAALQIRNRRYDVVPQASLYGPTTQAFRTVTHGGIAVGIGLTAAGWARLVSRPADAMLNRLFQLADVFDVAIVRALVEALEQANDDTLIAPILDSWLSEMLGTAHPIEDHLHILSSLIQREGSMSVDDVAVEMSMPVHTLRRVTGIHFGMPPKLLLSRARFLRSFTNWILDGEPPSYYGIDKSYYDASHFIRDGKTYLGTSPKRFSEQETTFLRASLRSRAAVIGPPAHALHPELAD